jgi:type IV pilus modification protein PilV
MEEMMPVSKNPQSGFSLVEMLVAIMILAVGLLGLAQLQLTSIRTNSHSETMMAAGALAQRELEEVVAMSASDPWFDMVDSTFYEKTTGSPVTVVGAGSFRVYRSVDANYQSVPNVTLVTVRVQSAGNVMTVSGSQQRTVELTTLKRAL